jgi:spore germination protein YaaH
LDRSNEIFRKDKETANGRPTMSTRTKRRGLVRETAIILVQMIFFIYILIGCATTKQNNAAEQSIKVVFNEVWGYLIQGKEDELIGQEPLTDICYFAANLTNDGRITDAVPRPVLALRDGSKPKIHLAIADLSNSSLMHFSLSPAYGIRPLLINDICRVSQDFDGVQIDFEAISPDDAQYFWDFLKELRDQLPSKKMLSIAVPARTGEIFDAYQYWKIAPIVDRVVIMAYDEHWSDSSPGPVASLPWCVDVIDYALSVIEKDRIVMGLPLYGRAWQDKRLAKALGFHNVQDIIAAKNAKTNYQSELGSYFEYSERVMVKVFYDDLRSIREKLQLYNSKNVKSVAFWRIGLGPADLWNNIGNAGYENMHSADQGELGLKGERNREKPY